VLAQCWFLAAGAGRLLQVLAGWLACQLLLAVGCWLLLLLLLFMLLLVLLVLLLMLVLLLAPIVVVAADAAGADNFSRII